ncbi:MAG: cyclic nucleotide-binding domain-containing protein [Betaproteobacteria bacterium]|nr:cyclic nucleotide-binding domain-containing protein [Betaproteobacteria bacterium]MBL8534350.1 cyclic nucleotide-binding domain-containing protein [Betaproteobacteria bacterium]
MDTVDADIAEQAPKNETLKALEYLGEGSSATQRIFAMIGHSRFFSDFTRSDIELLARSMSIYRADAGQTIIREGDVDDYMLLIIEGRVDIVKRDRHGMKQSMTSVGPGATLGEMSMIDGEPRFATCNAAEPTTFAVLSRDGMVRIILEEPSLGAKILIKLVTLLSARLRQTSHNLLHYMEK